MNVGAVAVEDALGLDETPEPEENPDTTLGPIDERLELALAPTGALELEGGELLGAATTFDLHGVAVSLAPAPLSVPGPPTAGFPRQFELASGVNALELASGAPDASAGSPGNPEPRGGPSFVNAIARSWSRRSICAQSRRG